MNKLLSFIVCLSFASVYANQVNISSTQLGGTLDNQVSAGCETGNQWDLESTLLNGSKLSIAASYNLKNGQYDAGWNQTFSSGDLFIDINGDAKNASNPSVGDLTYSTFSNSLVNYDYALHLDYNTNTYQAYQLNSSSVVSNVYWDNYNAQGNPLAYVSGGTLLGRYAFTYQTGLADNSALGFTSWGTSTTHNEITIDLADIGLKDGQNFTSHFTIGCGNDVAVGKSTVSVPEPASFSMLLIGLMSFAGGAFIRKRK